MNQLQKILSTGDIDKLFEELYFLEEELSSSDITFELTLLKARKSNYDRELIRGLWSHEETTIEKNKLLYAASKLCEIIEQYKSNKDFSPSAEEDLKVEYASKFRIELIHIGKSALFFKGEELTYDRSIIFRVLNSMEDDTLIDSYRLKRVFSYKHRNIVKLIDEHLSKKPRHLILEYIDGIKLNEILATMPLDISHVIEVSIQLSDALYYMHTHGEFHKNVTPSKILIDHEFCPVISPFEVLEPRGIKSNKYIEDYLYSAPENFENNSTIFDDKSDQFSLGLVIYEMIIGSPLFGENLSDKKKTIQNRERFLFNININRKLLGRIKNRGLVKILSKMLSFNPEDRYHSLKDVNNALKSIPIKKEKNIELILESYRRCCINNSNFTKDFYEALFREQHLGQNIHMLFKQNENEGYEKIRRRKLKITILLLTHNYCSDEIFERLIQLPGHQGLSHSYYEAFLNVLVASIEKNDFLWHRYQTTEGNILHQAWEDLKKKILEKIDSVRMKDIMR